MPASVRDVLLMIRTKEDAQRALAGISREMRRASAVADAANARARARALRYQAEQMRLTGATREQIVATTKQARAFDDQARSIGIAAKRAEIMNRIMQDSAGVLTATGLSAMAAGAGIAYGLKQAIDVAAEYDRQTRLTFTQVDRRFKPSLIELGQIGRRVAREIAIPFEQIQPALFEVFSSTEANVKQAEELLKSFSKAAVAGQTDVQTASRATIGLMNAYSVPFSKVNRILDIQFQLVQEGVGTYEEWSQRIGLVTPSAVRAGQSIETMAAALATSTRMGVSAARAGTSVARAFDAISNPKTIKKLESMGVKMRDAKGNMLPLLDIMRDWKTALEKLPPKDRLASILDTLKGAGSTIEARRFLQNMLLTKGGIELFQEVLGEMTGDLGAFDRAYNEMAGGVSSKSVLVRNQWMLLKEAIGRALMPAFSALLTKLQQVLDWFNSLPAGTQKTIATVLVLASAAGILGGALAIVIGGAVAFGFALATIGVAGLKVIAVVTLIAATIAGVAIGLKLMYDNSYAFRALVEVIWQNLLRLRDIAVEVATGVAGQFRQHLLPALQELWRIIEVHVIPRFREFLVWAGDNLIPKLREAGRIAVDVLGVAFKLVATIIREYLIPTIQRVIRVWDENKAAIMPVLQALGQIIKVLLIVAAVIVGVFIVALAAAIAVAIKFGASALEVVLRGIAWVSNAIKTVIGWIKSLIDWFRNLDTNARKALRGLVSATDDAKGAIVGAFKSAGTWLLSAGQNIVSGLINGIRGRIDGAAEAAASLGRAAMSAATSALKVFSPSRVFMHIGDMTGLGFIRGIQKKTPAVIKTVRHMAKSATANMHAESRFNSSFQGRVGSEGSTGRTFAPIDNSRTFEQKFYITTREIDPRKNAADLGWEMQGRLR